MFTHFISVCDKRWLRTLPLFAFVFIFICISSTAALAQGTTPNRGFSPAGSYALTDLESVNTVNGNVMFRVPLASLPAGRGGLSAGVSLMYSSKLWDTPPVQVPDPNNPTNPVTRYYLKNSPQGGWRYGVEYKLQLINKLDEYMYSGFKPNCETDAAAGTEYASRVWKLQMVFPDGSVHEFIPEGYQDAYHTYGDGYYNIHPEGWAKHCVCILGAAGWSCQQPMDQVTTGTMSYYSTDGTYMRLEIPHDSSTNMANKAWTLYLPNGGRVTSNGITDTSGTSNVAGPQRIYDRNNNYIEIQKTTHNAHPATKIVDQLNRSITIEHGAATNQDNIYSTGAYGEPLQWAVKWKTVYVNKTYNTNENGNLDSQNLNQALTVVDQVILPSQAGNLTYTFSYNGATTSNYPNGGTGNPSVGWGEISSITLPSGAQASYTYQRDNISTANWYEVLQNSPTQKDLTYLSEYDGNSTSTTETWHYSFNFSGKNSTSTLTQVTSPSGGVTSDYIKYSEDSPPGFDHGLSYRTDSPDGTIIERRWLPNTPPAINCGSCNAYIKTEYVTIKDASGYPAKTAAKDFTYDKNGNVTSVAEYDWVSYNSLHDGSSNPTWSLAGLTPKRVTTNTYYSPTPDASVAAAVDANAYYKSTAPRLRTVLKTSEVGDGTQILTRDEFVYDNAATTGNLTEQKSWDSAKGAYISPLTAGNSISVSHQYDSYGNPTLSTDARGIQTKLTYGSVGGYIGLYPTEIISAYDTSVARTSSQAYDFYTGLVTSATDVDNNVTSETDYDDFGRPIEIRTAANVASLKTVTRMEYSDVDRRVITRSDINVAYDGKLVSVQHYDQLGQVRLSRRLEDSTQSATDETTGIKVQTRYLTDVANHFNYQLVSNPYRAAKSTEAGAEATMGWTRSKADKGGRMIEAETFAGNNLPAPWGANTNSTGVVVTTYDANFKTVTDQATKARRSMTDGLGRLARVDEPNASNNFGTVGTPTQPTSYTYDALGNLIQVTQGVQTRTFSYSSLSRLTSAANPEAHNAQGIPIPTTYQYDANGNLTQKTDARGVTTAYQYDALNRLTLRDYPGSTTPQVTYTYDTLANGKGRLTSVVSSVSANNYLGYDALGRVTGSSQVTDGVTYLMDDYKYDLAGNLTSQKYPSGRVVETKYDAAGRIAGVKNQDSSDYYAGADSGDANRILYSAHGAVITMKLGNTLWEHTSFNTRLQPTEIGLGAQQGGIDKLKLNYAYGTTDNNGNVQSQTITVPGLTNPIVQTYSYDALNRLQNMSETGGLSQSFDYDRYGNRIITGGFVQDSSRVPHHLTQTDPTLADWYNQNTNRLKTEKYDTAGNVIKDTLDPNPGNTFDYDAENKQVRYNGGAAAGGTDYKYDGDGRRVKKVTGTSQATTIFVYDVMGQLVAEYTNTPPVTGSSGTSYLTSDSLGTPRIITGADGSVKARHDYLPFGEEIQANDLDSNLPRKTAQGYVRDSVRQKFTQKERDLETGLDYFEARYYSSVQGRFTSPDPLLDSAEPIRPQTWNRYAYVLNNPLRFVDPDGLRYVQRTLANGSIQFAWCATDECYNQAINTNSKDYAGWTAVTFDESKPFEFVCRGCGGGGDLYGLYRLNPDGEHGLADVQDGNYHAISTAWDAQLFIGGVFNGIRGFLSGLFTRKAMTSGTVKSTIKEISEELGYSPSSAVKNALKGRAPLESISKAEREIASKWYERVANEVVSGPKQAAAKALNQARAKFLKDGGKPPIDIHNFEQ